MCVCARAPWVDLGVGRSKKKGDSECEIELWSLLMGGEFASRHSTVGGILREGKCWSEYCAASSEKLSSITGGAGTTLLETLLYLQA